MICPKCKSEQVYVIDSREMDEKTIRRRRECEECKQRFTTFERIDPVSFSVIKKGGASEPYDRTKIVNGIKRALEKRPVNDESVEAMVDRIEWKLVESGEQEIASSKIGNLVIRELRAVDEVGYLRFASVYRAFRSLEAFSKEMKRFEKTKEYHNI